MGNNTAVKNLINTIFVSFATDEIIQKFQTKRTLPPERLF